MKGNGSMIIVEDKILKQSPLAEGGEGIIYEYKDKILKIYKDNVAKNEKLEKIKRLINKKLPSNVISPKEIVYDKNNRFLGYIMDKVEGEELKKLSSKKFLKVNNINSKDIMNMLIQIKNTLSELHKNNIYISDLNDCNILFDKNYNIYFIDVDSWTVDDIKCEVIMESFKDPKLLLNNFSDTTDNYAFSILIFKALTSLHPFGGTMNPDIPLLERMQKGISVINKDNIIIPTLAKKWDFVYPKLLEELKDIYENGKRFLINESLDHFFYHMKYCNKHNDYYYDKFSECPICNINAKIVTQPTKVQSADGIPYILLFGNNEVALILSDVCYLTNDGYVSYIDNKKKLKFNKNMKYYFSNDGQVVYGVEDKKIKVKTDKEKYEFDKLNKSGVVVKDKTLYFVDLSNTLTGITFTEKGNVIQNLSKVSFNNIFDIYDKENYFICNVYNDKKIINISGYNYILNNKDKIQDYGIHFDNITKKWLFIIKNNKDEYLTLIFDKNKVVYEENSIRYTNSLENLCFNNDTIFKPDNGFIKGFNFSKNVYKDFKCDIITPESKLIKEGSKFIVMNETTIYKIG